MKYYLLLLEMDTKSTSPAYPPQEEGGVLLKQRGENKTEKIKRRGALSPHIQREKKKNGILTSKDVDNGKGEPEATDHILRRYRGRPQWFVKLLRMSRQITWGGKHATRGVEC